jgi:hypothetical protein
MHKRTDRIIGLSRATRFTLGLLIALLTGCAAEGFDSSFAPTGAKGVEDEFGRSVYLDEECGGRDSPDYPDFYQNALFRAGIMAEGKLWLVDGSHLWSAMPGTSPASDTAVKLELAFIGHGNGIAAGDNFLAVSLVDGGVVVYPEFDLHQPVYLANVTLAIDVDAQGTMLAVAAGDEGLLLFDLLNPAAPIERQRYSVNGFASGTRFGVAADKNILYFSACRVVGYLDLAADEPAPIISDVLMHTNAKDAHGDGRRMAVANNGGGVWFFDMATMNTTVSVYEIPDPNFYANATYVHNEYAYVAAGNREIVALWLFGDYGLPEPRVAMPKDPLGITFADDIVYGFGNFRDVGERTVVRTTGLDDTFASARAFQAGLLNWVEPNGYALHFTDAENEWLVRREVGGYRVYQAAAVASHWTLQPDLRFYARLGTYSVTVTADSIVRVMADGATESTEKGEWLDPFPPRAFVQIDDGRVVTIRSPDVSLPDKTYVIEEAPVEGESNRFGYSQNPGYLCGFANKMEQGGLSKTVIKGAHKSDNAHLDWCSRLVDPFIAGNRPGEDSGFLAASCVGSNCITAAIYESGVIGVIPLSEDDWLVLVDDRSAYTTSILRTAMGPAPGFVLESSLDVIGSTGVVFVAHEKQRYVRFGRAEGWKRLDDGTMRVWMADGSTFTYDPERNLTFNTIAAID